MLPVTLRNLESPVAGRLAAPGESVPGRVAAIEDDRAVVEWLTRLNEIQNREVRRGDRRDYAREGELSIFDGATVATRPISVPRPGGARAFEVVGIPLERAGFYVVELASPKLGAALHGENAPYYVQTAALVTNLSVHFKWGRESSLAWVTTLDQARPVAGAAVAVRDCRGRALWEGKTGADGVAPIASRAAAPGRAAGVPALSRPTDGERAPRHRCRVRPVVVERRHPAVAVQSPDRRRARRGDGTHHFRPHAAPRG